ncbi:MAG: hypothetical protein DKT66_00300 [Candidatus Melainabacteria bacterium]|nr:MAG: hypothetical protein DKT66_00300 [Candidatus Melainabacteria bacterium]
MHMENSYSNSLHDSESTQVLSGGGNTSIAPGTILLEKFRVIELLGEGGMGSVYRVDHLLLEKQFAFKCLNKSQEAADASWKRFQNEAKAAQLLDHPNLLKVFEFGLLEKGQPFFLMELIEGKTLADEIKSLGHLPTERAVSLFIQVAFAIDCAHTQRIVHRDLKPSNIMIVPPKGEYERESVKVVDFGIAKLTGIDEFNQQTLTKTGEIFGSPFYMSPEQCMGLPVDHRSDLYSLGCVMYETLTSAPPFMGETALSTMMKHQGEKQMSLKEASMGGNYPQALELIIELLLQKDPEKRYQSAHQLATDLIALERDMKEGGDSQSITASGKYKATDIRERTIQTKKIEPAQTNGMSNVLKMAAFGALIYGLGVASSSMFFKPTAQPPPPPPSVSTGALPQYWSHIEGRLKVFDFPEYSVGTLILRNNRFKTASGQIKLGMADDVGLMIDDEIDKDPTLLTRFRPDDLVVLDYKGSAGNSSIYSKFKEFTSLRCLNVSGTTFSDKDLAILPHLPNLIFLNLSTCDVDCAQLAKYKEILNLQFLDISHLNAPEHVLKLIPKFKNLQELVLATNAMRDSDLKLIGKSKTIRVLNLANNLITDEGVKHLENMQSLEWLDLSQSHVTAKCVKSLVKLKNLRILEIVPATWPTGDVDAFSAELKKANPKLDIWYRNKLTYDPSVLLPFQWEYIGLPTHNNLSRILPDGEDHFSGSGH